MWSRVLRFRLAYIAGLAAIISTTSCATRNHITYDGQERRVRSTESTDPHFVYDPAPITTVELVTDESKNYEIRRLSFPSIGANGQTHNLVIVDYHRSRLPGSHPVVIVLPIWGRHIYPSNAIIRTLRKRSNGAVHILNVIGDGFLIDWPQLGVVTDEDEFMELWAEGAQQEITTLVDMRRLVDWTEARTEIDSDYIGLVGFSHGAMFAPTLATQEPRISTTALVMGGADPPRVIAQCIGARTEGVQIWAETTFGWSREEMEERLEPLYGPLDPARYPNRVDPAQVLMIEAGKDECIPESCRDDLWEAMGRPERYIINANHRHAFYTMTPINLNWARKRIWDFFESRLLEPAKE
jgi:dienelactone hydrolase